MADIPPSPGNPFWTFSLKLYSSTAVQQACLELQDGCGVDVNVMLYLMWLGTHGQMLGEQDTNDVLAAMSPWKDGIVVPLRTARRNLKAPPAGFDGAAAEQLRAIVKKAELEAERLQQSALLGLRPVGQRAGTEDACKSAAHNLASYGKVLGSELAAAPVGVMLSSLRTMLETG